MWYLVNAYIRAEDEQAKLVLGELIRDKIRASILPYCVVIDFDNTLTVTKVYPAISGPKWNTIVCMRTLQEEFGVKFVLFTCRDGEDLVAAMEWCDAYGICFDAVNANLPERIEFWKNDSRKISGEEVWDDLAVRIE
jgi:hypothetical protein